jgi:bifunctional DNA-binding transcriptional regulator/antitoxin component of YhaV-PrlF toxin-antitoxin module
MGTSEVATDERGRITIPKEVRERFGEHYRLVELRDGIKLPPRPENPVLRSVGRRARSSNRRR